MILHFYIRSDIVFELCQRCSMKMNESCRSICLWWQLLINRLKTSAKIQSQIAFVALSASVIKLHLVDHLTSSLQSGGSRGKKTVYIKEAKKSAFGLYFALAHACGFNDT